MRQLVFAFRASIHASALGVLILLVAPTAQALAEKGGSAASARLSPSELPADHDGAAMLSVPAAGRYAIRVRSPSGARIELVDMIEGPLDAAGAPGGRDGRIDAILDQGVYKLRVSGAKGASGAARLSAEPFQELNERRLPLAPETIQSAELTDLQQRSYAIEVGPEGRIYVEAIGRSLADLRLWRENGELLDLAFEKRGAEPKPGRPMTRIRLEGPVAQGRYTVTAYGGEPIVWSEGGKAQPFMIRLASPTPLDAGVAEGTLGPFGSARFVAQPNSNAFRLEAPQPAPLRLDEWRGGQRRGFAEIAKKSRDAFATLRDEHEETEPATLEVSGVEGQAYRLHALHSDARFSIEAAGPYLIGLDVAGQGADEVPATAIFARIERDGKTRVLASDAPRVSPRRPWRGRFNLRGPTGLLFEMAEAGPLAVEAKGVSLRPTIEPALSDGLAPRADGKRPGRYDLAKGFYLLSLDPAQGAGGVVDVTLGAPGVAAPEPAPTPARLGISFGEQKLERDGAYLILGNVAPELIVGPRVVALPSDLSRGPLALWQGAGETISIPVLEPKDGRIVAHNARGAEILFKLGPKTVHDGIALQRLTIDPSGEERALGLSFVANPATAQAAPEGGEAKEEKPEKKTAKGAKPGHAPLAASPGRPVYFDLGRDETREIRFEAPEGGLYRVETLGRLKTHVAVASNVSTHLGEGEDDGPGHNGLVVTYLRAGPYRALVTAKESAGRVGLAVTPVARVETATLAGEGSARATLDPGKGAAIPFDIATAGPYRLDLYGLGRAWRARLEDKDGWPLAKPGSITRLDRAFEKGGYRLVALPEAVEARLAFRLARVEPEKLLSGHGPHPLPFDAPQKLQWREPAARGAKRDPDVWRFSLKGDAQITLSLSEGMIGDVIRGENEVVGKVAGGRNLEQRLPAGDYRVETRALSSDDRLDYEISLSSKELQPEAPRVVELPAKLTFALAKESLVDLTSFGDKAFHGVLKNEKGEVVEQLSGRTNDWNMALARRLPAGAYRLSLHGFGVAAPRETPDEELSESPQSVGGEEGQDQKDAAPPARPSGIEMRLAFPEERDEGALAKINSRTFAGKFAHVLALPAAEPGMLAMVVAKSPDEVALSIERRDEAGVWRAVGARRGLSPFAAWLAPTDGSAWRVVAWTVGDAGAPIELAYRDVDRTGQRPGEIALKPVADAPVQPCVGLANLGGPSIVEIGDWPFELLAGSSPGQLLHPVKAGALASQTQSLWLASGGGDCQGKLSVAPLDWRGEEIALDLGAGETAFAPSGSPPSGKVRLFYAKSLDGRVGLDAGRGMAVASDATLAPAGDAPLRLWNAGGAGPLRLSLRALDVTLDALARAEGAFRTTLAPMSAKPVALTIGEAPLALEIPAGVAVFSAPDDPARLALYGGGTALAATHHGVGKSSKLWLVNLTDAPAPLSLQAAPGARQTLDGPHVLQGFFGAAGQIVAPVAPQKGDVLVTPNVTIRFVSAAGAVREGARIALDGPGIAILDHAPGLAAMGIERDGKGPWPEAEAKAVALPQRVALSGPAARFLFTAKAPALLVASGAAPAIARFSQGGRRDLEAFPNGVRLSRFVAAGDALLDLYSPHDGPLSGALDLSLKPAIEAHDGVNAAATLAPGDVALSFFDVKDEAEIGLGLRSDPDRVTMRLLSKDGDLLGEGVAQKKKLSPGRYFVEARAPAAGATTVVRLAIFGLSPPPAGPPEDVVADYLDKAGLKKSRK
ncbi:hypothetical protein [Methylocystis bryophila]|nr:hypothetical protein [Methylocystis bryophila]BDV37470.1 hypothetical protein DSM21852_07230 [Methylocystis bryophila]